MADRLAEILRAACNPNKPSTSIHDTNIAETLGSWSPLRMDRRIAIIMHPPGPGDLSIIRETAGIIQSELHDVLSPGQNVWTRLFWFLDGCAHSSDWSRSIVDVADATRQAHCYQGQTRYVQAYQSLESDLQKLIATNPLEKIDGIIMIGNKFSEDPASIIQHLKTLTDQGAKLFAFLNPPFDDTVDQKFNRLTSLADGGATLRISSFEDVKQYMPALTQAIINPTQGLLRLANLGDVGQKLALTFKG